MSKTGRSMGRGTVVESGYVRRLGIIAIICTTLVSAGYSAVPRLLNYQGKLSDGSGNPVNGTKNVVFAIYDVPSGGVALWSETAASVTVTNGLFSVILGSVTPLTLPFDTDYYLGIKVGSDPEMSPRLRLTSAAYALNSDAVDGKHASDMVTRIIQGSNITISPASGVGDVTVNASGGGGTPGNTATSVGTSTSGGASSNYSREDHAHNLGANVVLTGNIVDGTIGNGDLANGAVTDTKVTSVGWGKLTGVPAGFADGVDDTGGGGTPASTVTNVAGSQVVGTSGNYAREDHVHSIGLGVVTSAHILDGTVANADMANGAVTDVKVTSVGWGKLTGIPAGFADGVDDTGVGTPATTVTNVAGSAAVGVMTSYAREDHAHMIAAGTVTSAHILDGTIAAADLGAGAVTDVKVASVGWGKLTGVPAGFADGVDDTSAGTPAATVTNVAAAAVVGTSGNYAREDHVHTIGTGVVTSAHILDGTVARVDLNDTDVGANSAPLFVNTASSIGVSTRYARQDHVHTLATGVVNSAAILDGSIAAIDIANATITGAKIAASTITSANISWPFSLTMGAATGGPVFRIRGFGTDDAIQGINSDGFCVGALGGLTTAVYGHSGSLGTRYGGYFDNTAGAGGIALLIGAGISQFSGAVMPGASNTYDLGSTAVWWRTMYANTFRYKVAPSAFDIYEDDLAVADGLRITVIRDPETGKRTQVFDPASIPRELKDPSGEYVDGASLDGFLLSCIRKANGRIKVQDKMIADQEKRMAALLARIEKLEAKTGTVAGH